MSFYLACRHIKCRKPYMPHESPNLENEESQRFPKTTSFDYVRNKSGCFYSFTMTTYGSESFILSPKELAEYIPHFFTNWK